MQNRGQVTIFIIIAVVIVAAALTFVFLRGNLSGGPNVPASLQPVYNTFLSCLQQDTSTGVSALESQGGYIYLPTYEAGSNYMPFGSQLNFLGNLIPYWYYVSGNNVPKEQVPSLSDMQSQLARYVDSQISNCNFDEYTAQGFSVNLGNASSTVSISGSNVQVNVNADLSISGKNASAVINSHKVSVNSELGTLYASAVKVYDEEQNTMFLENYSIDTLRSYAPVDGVDITCAPKTWDANNVFSTLKTAIEENTNSLTNNGNQTDYFNPKLSVDQDVRFLNSQNWPSSYEVTPTNGNSPIMSATPVGNQQGLGILGFCYVPYHFVYSIKYPVLVQVLSSENAEEIFQFPFAVVIQNNNPRESLNGTVVSSSTSQLCSAGTSNVKVSAYDSEGNPVQANISYDCAGSTCSIGQTSTTGVLEGNFPQCVNGYVVASASGYKDARSLLTTTTNETLNIVMNKLYTENIELNVDGAPYSGTAVISFVSGDSTTTVDYPAQKSVQLSEGQYQIQASIYGNTSITLPATTTQQCTTVPRSGILGIAGLTQKQCFSVNVSAQTISNAIIGGGNQSEFILSSELKNSNTIQINAQSLPAPQTIQEVETNSLVAAQQNLDIEFK